ncbi:PAS domain S-box protein [bacterium]|nr:PAS domain S-box protein [bacterium]
MKDHIITILLVEDSKLQGEYFKYHIEESKEINSEVIWVSDMVSAIEQLETRQFDIVLLDLFLPDSGGIDSVTRVEKYLNKVPIIVLTSSPDEYQYATLMEKGVQDFFVKTDFTEKSIVRAIKNSIHRMELLKNIKEDSLILKADKSHLESRLNEIEKLTQQLKKSEKKYKTLMNGLPVGVVEVDTSGTVTFMNHSACDILGYEEKKVLGRKIWITQQSPVMKKELKNILAAIVKEQPPPTVLELTHQKSDKSVINLEIHWIYSRNEDHHLTGLITTFLDITKRKETEAFLRESEKRFKSVADTASLAIINSDLKGNIIFWNKAAETLFGYSNQEIIGENVSVIVPEYLKNLHKKAISRFEKTGMRRFLSPVETFGLKKDNTEFAIEIALSHWRTSKGVFITAMIQDISKRKEVEEELVKAHSELEIKINERTLELQKANAMLEKEIKTREEYGNSLFKSKVKLEKNEKYLQAVIRQQETILENSVVGILQEVKSKVSWWNSQITTMFQYSDEEWKKKGLRILFEDNDTFNKFLEESNLVLERGEVFTSEYQFRKSNGELFWCKAQGKTVDLDDTTMETIWIFEDISDRKKTEENLRKYKFMSDTSKDYMSMLDENLKYVAVNDAFVAAHSKSKETLLGKSLEDVWGTESVNQTIMPKIKKCFLGESVNYQNEFTFGSLGKKYMDVSFYPYLDDGKVKNIVAVSHDITELKESEERLRFAKEKAEETNRLKSDFINIISHELRTPLTVILSNIPFMMNPDDLPDKQEIAEIAVDIEDSAKHLLTIINDLLDFSKIEAGKMDLKLTDISTKTAIMEVCNSLKTLIDAKSLYLKQEVEDLTIQADPTRLRQILLNLVGNAIKFTEDGGIILFVKKSGKKALIGVTDTGKGIKRDDIPLIFDVFRQLDNSLTRSAGGTGLGLPITKKLVEMHGGTITVESEVNVGSTFSFTIPLMKNT